MMHPSHCYAVLSPPAGRLAIGRRADPSTLPALPQWSQHAGSPALFPRPRIRRRRQIAGADARTHRRTVALPDRMTPQAG